MYFDVLRLDHLTFFTDSEGLHLGCTTAKNGKPVRMLFHMDFEVFSNLIARIPDASSRFKLFTLLGTCLSREISRWEYISLRETLGQQLILTKLFFIPKKKSSQNSQKTEILGFINLSPQ